jgi:murein DD-endopeptidase MepM/ murein hydrolase activator NlpD
LHPARRPHATPSARRRLERSLRQWGAVLFRYRLRVIADLAVAALVLSLPFGLRAAPAFATAGSAEQVVATGAGEAVAKAGRDAGDVVALSVDEPARAQTVARGDTITAAGDPRTAIAQDVAPILRYRLTPADSLQSMANHFKVSAEAIAFSNNITDPDLRPHLGREIMIPPGEGALYTVNAGDTVDQVASRFKVDPKVIWDYNRLYFEPERFDPGKIVFVPGATVPGLVYAVARRGERVTAPAVLSRPVQAVSSPSGQFLLPVDGRITQPFWAFHSGVDVAIDYGTGVRASDAGTVIGTGWVPVGGMSIRVQHENGFQTGYYHLGSIFVADGQKVARGQIIGTIGMTGVTTGPHVHWEMKRNGAYVNPLAYTVR